VACIGLLLGFLAVAVRWTRARNATNADQHESLLYSHIPGTPSQRPSTCSTAAAGGSASVTGRPGTAVPKKLSNLPA